MRIRTHVGREFDLKGIPNRLMFGVVFLVGAAAVALWANGSEIEVLWAPVHAFLIWALLREIDPDHDYTAIIGAIAAGVWVLTGLETASALAVAATMVAARLVVNTTGRRPLATDLITIGVFGAAIAFSTAGYIAGFGLAVAIYVDDRMAKEHSTTAIWTAVLSALGATAVASLAQVFPQRIPDVQPIVVVGIGLLALLTFAREPEPPTSEVDSPLKYFIDHQRLHAGRSLVAAVIFASAVFAGEEALGLGPAGIALALAIVSNEIERIRRR